jgi:hypothetical protein
MRVSTTRLFLWLDEPEGKNILSIQLKQSRKLARRVDELELLLARLHRICAEQLGLRRPRFRKVLIQKRREARRRD